MRFVGSRPIIAVYGEAAYRAADGRGAGLGRYEAVCLPPADDGERASAFVGFPATLRARPVVIWPGPGADGLALAALDASVLADGIASAVGVAVLPMSMAAGSGLVVKQLDGTKFERAITLGTVAGRRFTPASDAFVKLARSRDWGPRERTRHLS